jgi:hypothetical protein
MVSLRDLDYKSILDKIKIIYKENYQQDDIVDLFSGKRKGFLKCDTKYHDLMHTLQIIPPFIGIIDGWNKSKKIPNIPKELFDIGIIAVLLHDTGYIKTEGDIDGTGGKYTFVHIQRSADFAGHYLPQIGFEESKIDSVKNIIMCTGVIIDYDKLPFNSEQERIVGYAMGTADLLGQMSAVDYPEKLPMLYHEFEEAYRYEKIEKLLGRGTPVFKSADELIKNTPHFYEVVVRERFEKMGSLYKYLTYHFKDSRNHFIEAIEENIRKIRIHYIHQ